MDTSTLLIVFLLITAASLASYALSQWSSIRGAIGVGWAASSVGTILLLLAAAIVVLTFVFRGSLWRPHLGTEQPRPESTAAGKQAWPGNASIREPSKQEASQSGRSEGNQRRARSWDDLEPDNEPDEQPESRSAAVHGAGPISPPPPLPRAFSDVDPWAATRCVYIYNPGSDPTHWKIENGCDAPVGIILSWCSETSQSCGHRASTAWKYPARPMIFPMQLQRPLPLDEQTVHGQEVRYVACFVATSSARELIAAHSEERASSEWRERFEDARRNDGCLTWVQNGSDEGRRTGMSIDAVLGVSAQLTGRGVPL